MKLKLTLLSAVSILLFFPVAVRAETTQKLAQNISQVFVTNWPNLFKTQEQNTDSNGNIKVHEQGTVNAVVANSSPIPVVVTNLPSPTPAASSSPDTYKVIKVFEHTPLPNTDDMESDTIDISGYSKITVQVTKPTANTTVGVYGLFSIDGTNFSTGSPEMSFVLNNALNSTYKVMDIPGGKVKFLIKNSSSTPAPELTLYLYLYR